MEKKDGEGEMKVIMVGLGKVLKKMNGKGGRGKGKEEEDDNGGLSIKKGKIEEKRGKRREEKE